MKKILSFTLLVLSLTLSGVVVAGDDLSDVKACLAHFKGHPFDAKNPSFQILSTGVKVFGVGSETNDLAKTEKPSLVLIKTNVTVLSKNKIFLMNPNGWYCLKGQVSVLGASEIHINCKAKIASSTDGVNVLGGSNTQNGVTVLGSSKIIREGCAN